MPTNAVQPFHVFRHRGVDVLIRVGDMSAVRIDPSDGKVLARFADGAWAEGKIERERLVSLGLLGESGEARGAGAGGVEESISCMTLFVTQVCNLRCVYCYGDGGGFGTGGTLTQATALRAIDWLIGQSGDHVELNVSLTGGEPLLNPELVEWVVVEGQRRAVAAGKRIVFGMTTNGTLLDDRMLEFLKAQKVGLVVSVDGPREIQDRQRPFADGRGSFDALLPRLRRLLSVLPGTACRATLVGDADPAVIRDALWDIGFRHIILTPATASAPGRHWEPSGGVEGLLRMAESEADAWIACLRARDRSGLERLRDTGLLRDPLVALMNQERRAYPCSAGLAAVGVSVSGEVYLCHRFVGAQGYRLGSVFETQLDRKRYMDRPVDRVEVCRTCFARNHCAGGCKHANAGATGDPFAPNLEMCRLAKRTLEMAAFAASAIAEEDRQFMIEADVIPPKPCPFDFP